jgi:antitoxin FitA
MGWTNRPLTLVRQGIYAMTTITIPLSEERLAQLRLCAEQSGLVPEEYLRRRVEQLLAQPDEQFRQAAAYILQKNAELYRRLA